MTTQMDAPVDAASPAPRRNIFVKLLLGVCCAAVAAMWIYYLASDSGVIGQPRAVYQVQDTSWRVKASPICKAAQAKLDALTNTEGGYITHPTHEQMLQRADIVDTATDIVERMLDDLVAIPVDNEDDATRVEFFAENYRIVLADRRRYTAKLREFKLEPYSETLVGGGPVSNVVLDFTAGVKGNDVPECSPPGELGGDVQP